MFSYIGRTGLVGDDTRRCPGRPAADVGTECLTKRAPSAWVKPWKGVENTGAPQARSHSKVMAMMSAGTQAFLESCKFRIGSRYLNKESAMTTKTENY